MKIGFIVLVFSIIMSSGCVMAEVISQEENIESSYVISTYAVENYPGVWKNEGGRWWYRHHDGTYTSNDWEKIDGYWYHFNQNGWMQTGWVQYSYMWYYLKETSPNQGVMLTGWQIIGGEWYYFKKNSPNLGAMLTGWHSIDQKWYYLNDDGVMQTGWQNLYFEGANLGEEYFNYFNNSGVWVTDSDIAGCIHGRANFDDFLNVNGNIYRYSLKYAGMSPAIITRGIDSWKNGTNLFFTQTENSPNLSFVSTNTLEANVLAVTYFYYNTEVYPWESNWDNCDIYLNEQINIPSGTIAHEVGHMLGLSHRITSRDSIMCQLKNDRIVSTPSQIDRDNYYHIYS